jgi:hypothetical protein
MNIENNLFAKASLKNERGCVLNTGARVLWCKIKKSGMKTNAKVSLKNE